MFPDGVGGFILEGFFELFEVILSYMTNTLSFLRVGGFVLSHAGMMLVVATLMSMSSGAGSIIVSILGNIFVIGLEGLIVGIQVLRLEFYEMFSRFFEGDGILFDPIF
jgi:V/A-type H+-transporting ATPase subunit I